jgi:hypothetical protein
MAQYWKARPRAPACSIDETQNTDTGSSNTGKSRALSDYDRYRQTLVTKEDNEGWASEKRRYLKEMPADVTKDTDVVEWWQVCQLLYMEYAPLLIPLKEPCTTIPYACSYCPRRLTMSSIICALRAPLFIK